MNRIVISALASLVLLSPGIARAQGTQPKYDNVTNVTNVTHASPGMYEDIEVMRRLMNEKLNGFSAVATIRGQVLANAACINCHTANIGVRMLDLDGDGRPDIFTSQYRNLNDPSKFVGHVITGQANPSVLRPDPGNTPYVYANVNTGTLYGVDYVDPHASVHCAHIAVGAASFDSEGTYLKGHGVVYTVTLPPTSHDPRPQAPNPPPKALSDWDRVRREVRQEKPAPQEASKQTKEPTLGDIVLKLLADNGKHFSQLRAEESLTVAITFRTHPVQLQDSNSVLLNSYHKRLLGAGTKSAVQDPSKYQETKDGTPKQSNPKTGVASTLQDYMLLADLHMKQNKAEEAINAYLKALEMKPSDTEQVNILQQLQRAYRQAKKEPEARLTEQKLKEYVSKMEVEQIKNWTLHLAQEAKPTSLPGKMIISATKKQLDDVGSGKMSFEDFRKAASVEFVTFPADKK
jgi:tetratricopeptide (TPR) repeat protein